ncbi:MAG: mechanosensitive ion channel, partial [Amphritea sp.]|nr:mechanosensitive ion channel [Amphritea sp.]
YRVGDSIKVVDKDDDISGIVDEITLFHVIIRRQGEIITYPNTLILQKAVIMFDHPVPNKETTEAVIHEPALDTKTTTEAQPTDVRPKET